MQHINANLMLRLLGIQEFFAHQWFEIFPPDQKKLAELISIRQKQQSFTDLINLGMLSDHNQSDSGQGGGSGRGTIKGLRAKDDPKFRGKNKKTSFTNTRMVR